MELLCSTNQEDNSNDSADMTNDNGGGPGQGGPLSGGR